MVHWLSFPHNRILYDTHRKSVLVLLDYLGQQFKLSCQSCLVSRAE